MLVQHRRLAKEWESNWLPCPPGPFGLTFRTYLGTQATGSGGSQSAVTSWVFTAFGVLLLLLGITNWRNRADTSEPAMLAGIGGMGPGAVAFLALGATIANPKNLPLLLSGGATVSAMAQPLLAGLVLVLLATCPYWGATLYALFGGAGAQRRLDAMRTWLVRCNRWIMAVVCTLLGVVLLARGITALTD